MATIIKLQRRGAPHKPFWRIVVTDKRKPNGCIEQLGTYNNMIKPAEVMLDKDRAAHWLVLGAAATSTVQKILRDQGIVRPAGSTETAS